MRTGEDGVLEDVGEAVAARPGQTGIASVDVDEGMASPGPHMWDIGGLLPTGGWVLLGRVMGRTHRVTSYSYSFGVGS